MTDIIVEKEYKIKAEDVYEIVDSMNRIFICVSIGLPFDDYYCYKFIASIIGL